MHIYELGKVHVYGGNYIIQNFSPWQFSVAWGENHPLYVPVRVKNLFWVKLFDIRTQNSLHVKHSEKNELLRLSSLIFPKPKIQQYFMKFHSISWYFAVFRGILPFSNTAHQPPSSSQNIFNKSPFHPG